ncbi:Retinol dehydrogenase 12 [Lamellibrachia satsuma]|nr:Retinol dehydrogenase 12 [Lamellibrachia satsuma]
MCEFSLGVGTLVLRRYFSGGECRSQARLDGKTIIVTGANTGIGKETARDIARRGGHVILACRDLTKAEQTAAQIRQNTGNGLVTVRIVDLASLESVRKFCRQILETEQRVDILINSAGVMWCPYQKSADDHEMHFAVNHLGPFLLTNLLLDLLKSSTPCRIINVSSCAHETAEMNLDDLNLDKGFTPQKAYCQSKLANILFTRELSHRLKGTGVSVFAVHPGLVHTELGRHVDSTTFPWWKRMLFKPFIAFCFKTPRQGAQTTIHCAVTEGLEKHSGKYFSDCEVKTPSPMAQDDKKAQKLWDISAQLVQLDTSRETIS